MLLPLGACLIAGPIAGCASETGPLRVAVAWSGRELAAFRKVLDAFAAQPFGVATQLVPMGDDIAAALGPRPVGAPDVVLVPQPGLIRANVVAGRLLPLPFDEDVVPDAWRSVVSVDRRPYGLPFKVAHKSCVWYRRQAFDDLGEDVPGTWGEWIALNNRLINHGLTPLALGASDGWVLTDFFENVLLSVDAAAYRRMAQAGIGWTSAGVQEALRRLGRLWGTPRALAGGVDAALATQHDDAVLDVFARNAALMVAGSDFVYSLIDEHGPMNAGGRWDWDFFPFPSAESGEAPPLVVGGDVAVVTAQAPPSALALVEWLAGGAAARIWAGEGGFLSLQQDLPDAGYRHPILAGLAKEIREVDGDLNFDLSDHIGALGGRLGSELQRFLRDVQGAQQDRIARLASAMGERMSRPMHGAGAPVGRP